MSLLYKSFTDEGCYHWTGLNVNENIPYTGDVNSSGGWDCLPWSQFHEPGSTGHYADPSVHPFDDYATLGNKCRYMELTSSKLQKS